MITFVLVLPGFWLDTANAPDKLDFFRLREGEL